MRIGFDMRSLLGAVWFGSQTGTMQAPAGVAGYAYNILKHLIAADGDNEFILFFNSFKTPALKPIADILERPNVRLAQYRLPNKVFDRTARFFDMPRIDKMLEKKYGRLDIYFSPHLNICPLNKQTPYVLTVHDLSFEIYPEFFPWRKRFWHWSQQVHVSCQRADQIIAVSENTKRDIVDLYKISPEKIQVVYSGVNKPVPGDLRSKIDEIKRKYRLPANYILYLGTLEPRKNVESVIDAFDRLQETIANAGFSDSFKNPEDYKQTLLTARIKSCELVLGGGPGWLYKPIFRKIKQSKFRDKIQVLGYVPESDKAPLIENAQAFVFPSYYEGFGFPALEAISLGTPVVTTLSSSVPEIVKQKAILIDPYNIQDLTEALYRAISRQSGKSGQHEIVNEINREFNWPKAAGETLYILRSVASVNNWPG